MRRRGIQAETCLASITGNSSSPTGGAKAISGSRSDCESYREEIICKLEQGLTAQRIWQDLVDEYSFTAKYHSVRRYVAKLQKKTPKLVRRMEVAAGEEAQVDFGTGAWIKTGDGKRRRTWVFRIVLSHSRKAYSEAVYHQSTEAFLGALESSFRYFGGTTKQQARQRFEEIERPALLPLPNKRFPFFHESRRSVNRDGHIEVANLKPDLLILDDMGMKHLPKRSGEYLTADDRSRMARAKRSQTQRTQLLLRRKNEASPQATLADQLDTAFHQHHDGCA